MAQVINIAPPRGGAAQRVALFPGMGIDELQSVLGTVFSFQGTCVGLLCEVRRAQAPYYLNTSPSRPLTIFSLLLFNIPQHTHAKT